MAAAAAAVASKGGASKPASDEWQPDEQKRLEEALKKFPGPGKERWTEIAKHVGGGRTRKQCVERYKVCVAMVKQKQAAGAK